MPGHFSENYERVSHTEALSSVHTYTFSKPSLSVLSNKNTLAD